MRSVRLSDELEKQLADAARACGEPISEFIREAIEKRCKEVLSKRLDMALADIVGIIDSRKPTRRSENVDEEFGRILREKRRKGHL